MREDIETWDGLNLAATLQRDLITPFMRMNFGDDAVLPQLVIRRPDAVDRDALVRHVTDLVPLGLKVSTRFMGDQLGVPTPEDDEDLLVTPTNKNNLGSGLIV